MGGGGGPTPHRPGVGAPTKPGGAGGQARRLPWFLARARTLLLAPRKEWAAINAEFTNTAAIYRSYVIALAAIGPIAATAGTVVFGVRSTLFGTYEMSLLDALTSGVLTFGFNLLGVYVLALVIDFLAPTFGGQQNPVQAFKAAAYGSTPYWIGGAFAILPKLTPLGILLALYSVRMFSVGLPLVMKAHGEKATGYALATMVAGVLVALFSAVITSLVL